MKRAFVFLLPLLVAVACTHHIKLNPTIDVSATVANQLPLTVGLYVPSELRGFRTEDRADWADKYVFDNMGEAISSIIQRAMRRVFIRVELLETYPTQVLLRERNLDTAVIPRLGEGTVALHKETGFWSDDAAGQTHISVYLAFFDPELIQFSTVHAEGIGIGEQGIGLFSSGKSEYAVSVEKAIRNLGNNLVHQIYGNYDIRTRAKERTGR